MASGHPTERAGTACRDPWKPCEIRGLLVRSIATEANGPRQGHGHLRSGSEPGGRATMSTVCTLAAGYAEPPLFQAIVQSPAQTTTLRAAVEGLPFRTFLRAPRASMPLAIMANTLPRSRRSNAAMRSQSPLVALISSSIAI